VLRRSAHVVSCRDLPPRYPHQELWIEILQRHPRFDPTLPIHRILFRGCTPAGTSQLIFEQARLPLAFRVRVPAVPVLSPLSPNSAGDIRGIRGADRYHRGGTQSVRAHRPVQRVALTSADSATDNCPTTLSHFALPRVTLRLASSRPHALSA